MTWPKSGEAPKLEHFTDLRKAHVAYRDTLKSEKAAELWESGLGKVKSHAAGSGKINFNAGKSFEEMSEDLRKEREAEERAESSRPPVELKHPELDRAEEPAKGKKAAPAKGKKAKKDANDADEQIVSEEEAAELEAK